MTQAILGAMLLAATGCAGTQTGEVALADKAQCAIEGKELDGLSHAAICAAAREGFEAAGGDPATPIRLRVLSAYSLEGAALHGSGEPAVELTFDVMDAGLTEDMVRGFGRDLANQLARTAEGNQ
ncbi:hypothetical protein K3172_14505 [Qipengyuania sp. 6B39]|uniref:hypothetical protein n=1 Tax=Qipengyuania proteolytica TaxID=2867239 RepID=UPI001C896418|nr:hypothetical protein [Qipengyuania proteolytica]MBX7497067.1 hypothetical protein [Qipengyuania proteolytica]